MRHPNWRPTSFERPNGSAHVAPDDWTLYDDAGRPLARIYRYLYGPNAGRWLWIVLNAPKHTPFNAGTGYAATGLEALEICEDRVRELSYAGG